MTATMKLLSASFEPSTAFEESFFQVAKLPETSTQPDRSVVVSIDRNRPATETTPKGFISIEELNAKSSKIEARKVALEEARLRLAAAISSTQADTIKSYRLKKGWSQAQLAAAIGTSQPHIARIERGTENLLVDTCRRLGEALGIDMNTIDSALRAQEAVVAARASSCAN